MQSILLQYNPIRASIKPTILGYFWKNLKPFIQAKLEHQDLELKNFDQIVKKTINVKAKAALWPHSSTRKMDQNCPCGNQIANSIVAKGQSNAINNPLVKKPKTRGLKFLSGPKRSNKPSKKARKEKKKEQCQKNWEYWESSTSAIGVNVTQTKKSHQKKKNKYCLNKWPRNTSQIKCFNHWKMSHYANTCLKPKN